MESWCILSPEYFNEASSHSVVQTSFYKSFGFCSIRSVMAVPIVENVTIYIFPLFTIKTLLAITVAIKCLY